LGYARVSTQDQDLSGQIEALKAAGATTIYREKVSGVRADRPQLAKLMAQIGPGDIVVVTKLDRLGRSGPPYKPSRRLISARPDTACRSLPQVYGTVLAGRQGAADRRGCELRPPRPSDHRPSIRPWCAIAMSTATIRGPIDHPTIDHRERLRDRRSEIAADPFRILYQKNYALCGNCLHLQFGLIQPLRRLSVCSECVAQRQVAVVIDRIDARRDGPDGDDDNSAFCKRSMSASLQKQRKCEWTGCATTGLMHRGKYQAEPFPRSLSGTCLSSALLTNSTESIAAPSWAQNCSIASFIGGGRSPQQP
jgi:hypothetical protein